MVGIFHKCLNIVRGTRPAPIGFDRDTMDSIGRSPGLAAARLGMGAAWELDRRDLLRHKFLAKRPVTSD